MDSYKTYNDKELVGLTKADITAAFNKLAAGDHDAFRIIFHHFTSQLFPHILHIVKSKQTAEEIVQETFMKLWLNRETVSNMDNPAGWIFTVASNLSFNVLKKAAYEEKALLHLKQSLSMAKVDDVVVSKQQQEILSEAINDLPTQRRIVFKLSREQGLTHQQIAEQLNISPNTVKNQLVTALKFIRDYMRKSGALFLSIFFL